MIMMLLIVKAICWASDFHLNCSDSELQRDPGPVELIFLAHKPAEIVIVVPKLNTTPNKALHSNTYLEWRLLHFEWHTNSPIQLGFH